MAKAPRAGKVKTRLCPPLTPAQSAALNVCFLMDTTENIASIAEQGTAAGLVSYTPIGDEALFEGILPPDFALIAQRGEAFGERLLAAAQDILDVGFGSVCLIDSDSPTVPPQPSYRPWPRWHAPATASSSAHRTMAATISLASRPPHPEPFANITWSTGSVCQETCDRIREAGLELVLLPTWYDVDDGATLELLAAELLASSPPFFTTVPGYPAPPHPRVPL